MANFILAAGGTGGHIFPALAVAEQLSAMGHHTTLFTDKRGVPMVAGKISYRILAAGSPFQRAFGRKLLGMAQLSIGLIQALGAYLWRRPHAVIGFGGYPSFAPVLAARLLGIRCYLHEQNGVMGRANQILARLSHGTALSWDATKYVPHAVSTAVTGMPVRDAFFATAPYRTQDDRLHIVITGGSLGAKILSDVVPVAIAALAQTKPGKLQITQQARAEDVERLKAFYQTHGISATIASFFDHMAQLYDQADIIIGRSGASSVAEIAAAGRASILVPFAAAMDDHQTMNAQLLSDAGAAYLIDEADCDETRMLAALQHLCDGPIRQKMAERARDEATPQAPLAIAKFILLDSKGAQS